MKATKQGAPELRFVIENARDISLSLSREPGALAPRDTIDSMALRFLERILEQEFSRLGREDLMDSAVGGIGLTDDGSTVYVHLTPRPGWSGRARGRAYVLAWQDYAEDRTQRFDCYRWLMDEASLAIGNNAAEIVRWLEGK